MLLFAVWNIVSLILQSAITITYSLRDYEIKVWQRIGLATLDGIYALVCLQLFKRYMFRDDDEVERQLLYVSMNINTFNWMWAIYFIGKTILERNTDETWEYAVTIGCLVFLVINPIADLISTKYAIQYDKLRKT